MKLNNKGYLIVEVILAGVLTFTMAYFLINLTLKIRNRYDDVNVETVMLNDKTVITNEIMGDVVNNEITNVENITNGIKINFEDGNSKELTIVNNTITYGTYTKKFSENAIVGNVSIRRNGNYFLIEIPVTTKYSDKDYGINIVGFTKEALEPLTCNLTASSSKITANFDGNMIYYGWNENYSGASNIDKDITEGIHTYYIKDAFGNTGSCSINISKTESYQQEYQVPYQDTEVQEACMGYQTSCDCQDGNGWYVVTWYNYTLKQNVCQCCFKKSVEVTKYKTEYRTSYRCSDSSYTKVSDNYCYKS